MNILFHRMRTGRQGQVMAMVTIALITFLVAAFLTVNIGKTRIQGTKVSNGAQAAVMAGGSAACVLLNSMANINQQMVQNFAGFTLMMQILIISWMIDFVKLVVEATRSMAPYQVDAVIKTSLAVITLAFTTVTIALLFVGANKVGNQIARMIRELNDKVPKASRDSARQYGFSNAGVDEPKISFARSGCGNALCYSLIETEFDAFMRLLPATNRADTNYGTSTLEFSWQDSRTGNIVNSTMAVTVTPIRRLQMDLITFGEVAANSGAINAYLGSQDLGVLGPIIRFGVTIANVILALIIAVGVVITALAVVLDVIAVLMFAFALGYTAICAIPIFGAWACPFSAYYWYANAALIIAAAAATAAMWYYWSAYNSNPPSQIPCFYWDRYPPREYPITSVVRRTTSPSSIRYGIYTTNWPAVSGNARGLVRGGSIFPPLQKYDIDMN